jgi:hypothetical protein
MMSDESVKIFVRNTLGCDCAEEVFSHIENERDVEAGGATLKNKINVGNRLLVYVVEAHADILKAMPALVSAGKKERDARGFNRFRLVLVSDDKKLKKRSLEAFKAISASDQKIHLHVIGKNEAKGIYT